MFQVTRTVLQRPWECKVTMHFKASLSTTEYQEDNAMGLQRLDADWGQITKAFLSTVNILNFHFLKIIWIVRMIQSNIYTETLKFTVAEGWRTERGSGSTNPKVCLLHQPQDPSDWKLLLLLNWFVKSNTQPDKNYWHWDQNRMVRRWRQERK